MQEGTLLQVLGGVAMYYTVTHWIWVVKELYEVPILMEKEGTLLQVLGGLAMPYTVTHWIWVVEEHNEVPNLMEGLIYRVNLKQNLKQ